MARAIQRTDKEVDDVIALAQELAAGQQHARRTGPMFRGPRGQRLTYEQGWIDAIAWITGESDDKPRSASNENDSTR